MALFATIDGKRLAFTGDAFFPAEGDGALRHNLIFRNHVENDSHLKSIRNLIEHEPHDDLSRSRQAVRGRPSDDGSHRAEVPPPAAALLRRAAGRRGRLRTRPELGEDLPVPDPARARRDAEARGTGAELQAVADEDGGRAGGAIGVEDRAGSREGCRCRPMSHAAAPRHRLDPAGLDGARRRASPSPPTWCATASTSARSPRP